MHLPGSNRPASTFRHLAAVAAFAALCLAMAGAARAATAPETRGAPTVGSMGLTRTTADIMREEALHAGEPAVPALMREHDLPSKVGVPQNPLSQRVASIPAMPVDQLVYRPKGTKNSVFSPQTVGLQFDGASLSGTNPTSSFPPDNDGAVGPTQYVIGVNGRIVSFNKTTGAADGVINATTNSFFSTVRNASSTSDPTVRYDRLSNRWFVTIINVSTPNRWLLAVSDAASNGVLSASTVWTYFFIVPATQSPAISNGTSILSDYPTLGIDQNALYVGVDEFVSSTGAFQQTDVFVVRKSSVLGAGPIVVTMFRSLMSASTNYVGPYAPRGVDNPDPTSNEGYFVSPDGASWGTMWIHKISDPGGTPAISAFSIALPAEDGPRPVVHPGNTGGYWGYLDALDDRYFQGTIRNGQLWTVHNIGVDNTGVSQGTYTADARSAARWFQLNVPTGAGTPTIVQSGTVFTASASNDSLQKQYFIPSLTVTGQGHVAMGFSTAGASNFVNAEVTGRFASDPAGTMQAVTQVTSNSSFSYNPASDPGGISAGRPRRWGDYTQTLVDPLDDQTVWTVQQYVNAANSYACRIIKLNAPPPATPSAMAPVPAGLASYAVTLTGTSASGSAFFDPGANLPSPARAFNHLAAAITTGGASGTPPTVVSATYVNATTVNLVLNTSSATANLPGQKYTITITNPDGQTAAAAVVQVVNPTITATAGANGTITPSGSVTVAYGGSQAFSIAANACYSIGDVVVDGASVGAVSSYTFTNVTSAHTIAASFVAGLTSAATGVSAAQVTTGNGPSGTTGVKVQFTPQVGASSFEVYRKAYGNYPTYAGGAAPAAPASYPPAGWTLTGVTASGQVDTPPSRDQWYYVVYGLDACSDVSPVSAVTGGALDYHLGDVSDGVTPGAGDNTVNTADASLIGAHYGATGAALAGWEYLDFGPTADYTTTARPTPDGIVDFEDLVMLALNFTPHVSLTAGGGAPLAARQAPAAANVLSVGETGAVKAGDVFDVPVTFAGTGDVHALSIALGWNSDVVKPAGVSAGDFVTANGGLVLSPAAGRADAALLGQAHGLSGTGVVATVRFQAVADGAPEVSIASVTGRDGANKSVAIATQNPLGLARPTVSATELSPVIPNPVRGLAQLRYALAKPGPVSLAIYSIDGRLVKTLAKGSQEAGRYQAVWNGTDEGGAAARSGVYFVRFEGGGVRRSRLFTLVR